MKLTSEQQSFYLSFNNKSLKVVESHMSLLALIAVLLLLVRYSKILLRIVFLLWMYLGDTLRTVSQSLILDMQEDASVQLFYVKSLLVFFMNKIQLD